MNTQKSIPQKQKKSFIYYVGTLFMVIPVLLLIYIYYPFISVYISSAPVINKNNIPNGIYIEIPKLKAFSPIVLNVDPWNETIYRNALLKGIAQAKGTSKPGEKGTIYLFAHSSDVPWRITRYNTAFFMLPLLHNGDRINIYNNGKEYTYRVINKKIISPTDIQYLKADTKDQIILQTCYPIGTSWQRMLIFAVPI